MAKKKNENTLSYLQMPLPQGGKYSRMTKVTFGGLNKRQTIDSGEMSMERNISTNEYPYLTPSMMPSEMCTYEKPICMFAFEDFIFVMYIDKVLNSYTTYYFDEGNKQTVRTGETAERPAVMVDYMRRYTNEDGSATLTKTYTGIVKLCEETDVEEAHEAEKNIPRSVVPFNVYDTPTDPVAGQYSKKLLIFPDARSMYHSIVEAGSNPENWDEDALSSKDRYVLYHYGNNYYSISLEEDTEDGDEDRITYKRVLTRNNISTSIDHIDDEGTTYYKEVTYDEHFCCDSMNVNIKEYHNDTAVTDESGATIYPPPDTASHNGYYRNTADIAGTNYGTDIYAWREYETAVEDDDGNWIPDGGTAYGWKVCVPPTMPKIKYATVHLSRVFGVDDSRVYASGFNDYTNWNLDTSDEYNEANSWCSPSQSNAKAGGNFTGITTFQNHVVCFKRDFMHEIYNTKNPFRIQDIYAEGAIDNRTIQDVDGKLIFVSEDDVKVYTGSNPRIIGYKLNTSKYTYAVSGTDNRNYYLYCEDEKAEDYMHLYVYDTYTDLWSEQSVESRVLSFAHNINGMYMLCENGCVYKMDTNKYDHEWSFETELVTNKTVDIKHIKKLQMLAELGSSANIDVYILYDDEMFDKSTSHLVYSSKKKGKYPIRVKPRKTANYGFKLHIEGKGYVKLYELEIFIEAGGDMYV